MTRSLFNNWLCCFAVLLAIALPSSSVIAQLDIGCSQPNLLALVLPDGSISLQDVSPFEQVTAGLYILNPSVPAVCAVEFGLPTPDNGIIINFEWTMDMVDVGSGDSHIVGFAGPVSPENNAIHLADITILYTSTTGDPLDIFFTPAYPASIPDKMAFLDCTTEEILPLSPISLSFDQPVFSVNHLDLDYCLDLGDYPLAVMISTAGDEANLAATQSGATDGYDDGLDLPDLDPEGTIYFPHSDWGMGGKFQHDIMGPYDPNFETKQWSFIHQSPVDQTQPTQVNLTFQTNIDFTDGYPVFVKDLTNGQILDLSLESSYEFTSTVAGEVRNFELSIGGSETDLLSFGVNVSLNQYFDSDNVGGFDPSATDGFDVDYDEPEPAPPPGDFLIGYFPHNDWPLGHRYRTDIRAPFNPLTFEKTWIFVVETDQSGDIVMDFTSDFGSYWEAPFFLHDMTSGEFIDLNLTPNHVFPSTGSNTYREFEILIGGDVPTPPPFSPTARVLTPGWAMVGFPLNPGIGQNSLDNVILGQAPGRAYMFTYDGDQGYIPAGPNDTALQGIGYWIATTELFTWTMTGQQMLQEVSIPLDQGWNMVGNPLWFAFTKNGIRVNHSGHNYPWYDAVSLGLVSPAIWTYWNTTDTYESATVLSPWQSYWFRAQVPGVSLSFNWLNFVRQTQNEKNLSLDALPHDQVWRTEFTLTDEQGRTDKITLGVRPDASAGFDKLLDFPHPPNGPRGGPSLSVWHPEWEEISGQYFSSDFINPGMKPTWITRIDPADSESLRLSWDRLNWPPDYDLQLYLPEHNRVIVMSMAEQGKVDLGSFNQPVLLQVRAPDFTSGADDLPLKDFDIKAHPNPFNPATKVSFNLPRPGQAELRIYSLRGELVDLVVGGILTAGRQELIWRGKNRSGQDTPSGTYFARIHFEGKPVGEVKKLVLIR